MDDVEECNIATLARFRGDSWEPGQYIAHLNLPGFAAQCRFELPLPGIAGFSACERDTTYAYYPEVDPLDAALTPSFDSSGIVNGVAVIQVSEILAEDYVHIVVERGGAIVFEEESRSLVLQD